MNTTGRSPGTCPTARFRYAVRGASVVFSAKFLPGMAGLFVGLPVSRLTEQQIDVTTVFGEAGTALASCERARDAVRFIEEHPQVTTVTELGDRFSISARALQMLFRIYVGVSPKWVIRRYRMHEALALLDAVERSDEPGTRPHVDLARLALDLGYADQAHFTRDFRATTGRTPARYP